MGLFNLASGALLPLSFYPQAVENFLKLLPYNYAVNVPVSILLGQESDLTALGLQVIWIPILACFIAALWSQAKRRIVILEVNMKKYISLYLYNIKVYMMAQMSFRVDFFIGLFSSLIEQIVYLIFLNILFGNIKEIAGFNYGQMLFIYGIATVGRSIHLIFFDNLWMFGSRYIRQGEFERLLLMPVNPLFQLICERIQPQGIGTTSSVPLH